MAEGLRTKKMFKILQEYSTTSTDFGCNTDLFRIIKFYNESKTHQIPIFFIQYHYFKSNLINCCVFIF